jgi:DNA-binding SARP family transcriptional activator/TolB-like protein/Tfp pilus assembly protein PilF
VLALAARAADDWRPALYARFIRAQLCGPDRAMFVLKLFGGVSIEGDAGVLTGQPAQRHRLALLALLAVHHPGALSRERAMAYLWPERDTERARNLLNQAVHALRRALGDTAVVSAGDELRLDAGVVHCDVVAFAEALVAGDRARAVELYGGPFLDGFFVPQAPEFDRWAAAERERWARAYGSALEGLAEAAATRGDLAGAVEWWRRLAARDPYNARVTLGLMKALAEAGDRAGAIQQARLHTALLSAEFDAAPDPEITTLIERLRAAPRLDQTSIDRTRDAAPVADLAAASGSGAGALAPPDAHAPLDGAPAVAAPGAARRSRGVRSRHAVALGAAALLGLTITTVVSSRRAGPIRPAVAAVNARGPKRVIAVLPFENLTAAANDVAFTRGIQSDLVTALSEIDALTVVSRAAVLPYRDRAPLPRRLGEELGADVLLDGSVQRLRDSVRVNVQLSDARTGGVLWGARYERELTVRNVFAIQTEITQRVAASLAASLTPAERERIATPPTESLSAYQYFHAAGAAFDNTRRGNLESARLLRLALAVDPEYAPAWADLAVNYGWRPLYLGFPLATWDSALVVARRALAADPALAGGYTALAVVYGHQGHLERSAEAARQALARDPDEPLALRRLAESYRERGAFPEALGYHLASVRLSPYNPAYRSWVGLTYADLGEDALARRWYGGVLAARPDFVNALSQMALLHLQMGRADSAVHYAERAMAAHPDDAYVLSIAAMVGHFLRDPKRVRRAAGRAREVAPYGPVRAVETTLVSTMLGFAYLETGDSVRADELFRESLAFLEPMIAAGATSPRWPYEIAVIRAVRGDREGAVAWLERAYGRGFRWAWMLERDPMLDSVRRDARVRALIARVRADVDGMRRQVSRQEPATRP